MRGLDDGRDIGRFEALTGFKRQRMGRMRFAKLIVTAGLALATLVPAGPAMAAPRCVNTGDFNQWLAQFKKEALTKGISQQTLAAAASDMYFEESVIKRDSGRSLRRAVLLQADARAANRSLRNSSATRSRRADS